MLAFIVVVKLPPVTTVLIGIPAPLIILPTLILRNGVFIKISCPAVKVPDIVIIAEPKRLAGFVSSSIISTSTPPAPASIVAATLFTSLGSKNPPLIVKTVGLPLASTKYPLPGSTNVTPVIILLQHPHLY